MCGIAGDIAVGRSPRSDRVLAAVESLRHRGPDARGFFEDSQAALGHTRLAIIDLDERSNQPIASRDGRVQLVYNGEIYNFRQLGPHAGDTLLVASDPLGSPRDRRGMFAYVAWDADHAQVVMARDRFGIKPLYFAANRDSISFGSTCGAVAQIAGSQRLDRDSLASYLRLGAVQGPSTIVAGVREAEPAAVTRWTSDGVVAQSYWSFDDERAEPCASLEQVLEESVALHAVSDVPVAVFLSGGLDSAVVAHLAARAGVDVTAVTLSTGEHATDEADEASKTAQHLGIPHKIIEMGGGTPDFDAYFRAMDQPSIDGLNTFLVAGAAAEAGFTVAMSGVGSDELFAGYELYRRAPLIATLNKLPRQLARQALQRAGGNEAKIEGLLQAGKDIGAIHRELRSVFSAQEVDRLCGRGADVPSTETFAGRTSMDALMRLELSSYLRNTLLRDADVFGMAHSVEIRTPFVDHVCLRAALAQPPSRRFWLRKRLLARALGDQRLNEIVRRRKQGFDLPFGRWLRTEPLKSKVTALTDGPLSSCVDLDAVKGVVSSWQEGRVAPAKVWSLVVLDSWLRMRLVR